MFSSQTKYALRSLAIVSKLGDGDFVTVKQLAEEAGVPNEFLSKIMKSLAANGLVETKKGRNGGVKLANREISYLDVCVALQEPLVQEKCLLSNSKCVKNDYCQLHSSWGKLRGDLLSLLKKTSIT